MFHTYHCPSATAPDYNPNYAGYSRSDYAGVAGSLRGDLQLTSKPKLTSNQERLSSQKPQPSQEPNLTHAPQRIGQGVFGFQSGVSFADIERGTQHTLLVGERSMTRQGRHGGIWLRSVNRAGNAGDGAAVTGICHREVRLNDPEQRHAFFSWHEGGAQFALADGSVRFIAADIDGTTYETMAQIRTDPAAREANRLSASR